METETLLITPEDSYAEVATHCINKDLANVFEAVKSGIRLWPNDDKLITILAGIALDHNYYHKAMTLVKEELQKHPNNQKLAAIRQAILARVEKKQFSSLMMLDYDGYHQLGSTEKIIDHWLNNVELRLLLLMQMSLVKTMQDRLHLLKVQAKWGAKATAAFKKKDVKLMARRSPSSKARVGIVSSHFADNYVGHFIRQFVEHFDQNKIELHCYSLLNYENDSMQQYTAEKADSFRDFSDEDDARTAQAIANDGLDALIEIGTLFHRTGVIVHKPAPMVISWLDYPNSSGLPVDYIVVDPYTNPPEETLLLEKPLILANTWLAIDPQRIMQAPITPSVPEDRNGHITFGTMNRPFKITLDVFKAWAEIMHQVPNSKFLYVGIEIASPQFQNNFIQHMKRFGIGIERLILTHSNQKNVCGLYNQIDIALDTFPRTGGTTTCEALWMGVPVVTLVGAALYERLSYSILSNAGLGELCAFTEQQYKNTALQLVHDKEKRRYLRQNLRQQILANPLGKPKEFAIDMGNSILNALNNKTLLRNNWAES